MSALNFSPRHLFLFALGLPAIAFSQSAPVSLTPTVATAKQVTLTWRAGDSSTTFIVQRRALGGSYGNLQNVTTTTATDTSIDPYTTYQYQVIATAGSQQSPASNEITVGPPPVGFNIAVTAPSAFADNSNFGRVPRMVLDQNGDPALIYLLIDPNGDENKSDSQLFFVKWDRLNYKWTNPLVLLTTGDILGFPINISLARDAGTNLFGAAYQIDNGIDRRIGYATSTDNGITWKTQVVITDAQDGVTSPSLALAGGQAFLAFYHDHTGIQYATGSSTANPTTWKVTKVPLPAGYTDYSESLSLAVDSAGNPGLAFYAYGNKASGAIFWRPGGATSSIAVSTTNSNDGPDVQLAFSGTQPRILFFGALDKNFFADYDHTIWMIRANDNGTSWAPPVNIPADGGSFMGGPTWLDISSGGKAAAVTTQNGGTGSGITCGQPKLSTSNDLVKWATCGPAPAGQPEISADAPVIRFGANERMFISFQTYEKRDLSQGIVVWREPLVTGSASPAISSGGVLNAASFAPEIAPGSLVTIFGSNFATTAAGATTVPLPKNLGGVTVTVNGASVPLFYAGVNQINFQMPYAVPVGTATIAVNVNGVTSASAPATIVAAAPGIFVFGNARAVVQNQDYSVNEANNPAKVGSGIVIYATGQGALDNTVPDGAVAPNSPLSRPRQTVTATIGGKAVPVAFAGLTPGLVGVLQVNLIVPSMAAGSYPIVLTEGGKSSNGPMVTIAP